MSSVLAYIGNSWLRLPRLGGVSWDWLRPWRGRLQVTVIEGYDAPFRALASAARPSVLQLLLLVVALSCLCSVIADATIKEMSAYAIHYYFETYYCWIIFLLHYVYFEACLKNPIFVLRSFSLILKIGLVRRPCGGACEQQRASENDTCHLISQQNEDLCQP